MFILSKFDDCSFLPHGSNGRGGATDHKMLAMLDLREFERPEAHFQDSGLSESTKLAMTGQRALAEQGVWVEVRAKAWCYYMLLYTIMYRLCHTWQIALERKTAGAKGNLPQSLGSC